MCLFVSPVSEAVFAPFMSSESVAFPSYIGFDLPSKLVWDATARSLHCTADNGKKSVENTSNRRDERRIMLKVPLLFGFKASVLQ